MTAPTPRAEAHEARARRLARARREQPIAELQRKAAKAKRRHWLAQEEVDLTFAEDYDRTTNLRRLFPPQRVISFCSGCTTFAPVGQEVAHKPRCTHAPVQAPVYDGTILSEPFGDPARLP